MVHRCAALCNCTTLCETEGSQKWYPVGRNGPTIANKYGVVQYWSAQKLHCEQMSYVYDYFRFKGVKLQCADSIMCTRASQIKDGAWHAPERAKSLQTKRKSVFNCRALFEGAHERVCVGHTPTLTFLCRRTLKVAWLWLLCYLEYFNSPRACLPSFVTKEMSTTGALPIIQVTTFDFVQNSQHYPTDGLLSSRNDLQHLHPPPKLLLLRLCLQIDRRSAGSIPVR